MHRQSDLTRTGLIFSIPVIVMGNIMIIAFVLAVLTGRVKEYPDLLHSGFRVSWDILRDLLDVAEEFAEKWI